ncbi:MAG: IPT/TIG domain-containing protein [Vicinamibacterales bacterium]|nr:IPT/TIG domain-containing protein [Vicinamibacterales bacterium]
MSSISPTSGTTLGGTTVTITGTNFTGTLTVTLGGAAATDVRVSGTTSLTAVTPAHAAGSVDVVVAASTGTATLTAGFAYVTPPGPTVSAVAPVSGSTAGGTTLTITGMNFASGATVTVGGVAATGVEFVSATSVRAVTGAAPAGAADVVVRVGNQAGILPGGFTYVTPAPNPPPVITALTIRGTRTNEPPNFAELDEEVVVTATVVDNETPIGRLQFEWTAESGTFTGTGSSVRWKAPKTMATPAQVRLTVRVTEPLEGALEGALGDEGPALTQSVTATATVHVHNSASEVGALAVRFLVEFSEQKLPPENIVRDFWAADVCRAGRQAELEDVQNNQAGYRVVTYNIGPPSEWTLAFGGTCPLNEAGDSCVAVSCAWQDIRLSDNKAGSTTGTCRLSAAYRQSRWWLCSSRFQGTTTHTVLPGAVPFMR